MLNLSDTAAPRYQFLTKIWAKQKIEYLLVQYFNYDPNSAQAEAIRVQIVWLSVNYGVISPFTSFNPPATGIEAEEENITNVIKTYELLGNFPNPFNSNTKIQFRVNHFVRDMIKIKIYNALGQLVRILTIQISGEGLYEVLWDGRLQNGKEASSGLYIYIIDFGDALLGGRMMLVK